MEYISPRVTRYAEKAAFKSVLPGSGLSVYPRIVKRAIDITISLLVIVFILSWLIPILALLIKLDSKGPVFFIQKRIGFRGRVFNCIKLRSMVVNEKANIQQAQDNDPRITAFGNFLRKSCLDEMPQFFNVLTGKMSIVGPRPHMIKDCKDFLTVIPEYNLRHELKPGITGMAQIKGYRGKTDSFYDVFHRYQWDMFYVRNACFPLDMKIIYKTFVHSWSEVVKSAKNKAPFKSPKVEVESAESVTAA